MLYAINICILGLQQGFPFTSSGSERSKQIMACTYVCIISCLYMNFTTFTLAMYALYIHDNEHSIFSRTWVLVT